MKELINEINETDKVLDIGCGKDSPLQYIKCKEKIGYDFYEPYIKQSQNKRIHNRYVIGDLEKFNLNEFFDCIIALEVIEHIGKQEGIKLLNKIEKITNKIIITVPSGCLNLKPQKGDNPKEKHISEWENKDFVKLGYKTYGLNGFRWMFNIKDKLELRKPKILFKIIRKILKKQIINNPDYTIQILAIKNKGRKE